MGTPRAASPKRGNRTSNGVLVRRLPGYRSGVSPTDYLLLKRVEERRIPFYSSSLLRCIRHWAASSFFNRTEGGFC